jgi:hypothetical protein
MAHQASKIRPHGYVKTVGQWNQLMLGLQEEGLMALLFQSQLVVKLQLV